MASRRGQPSVLLLVVMLLGACLGPVLVHGALGTSSGDDVELDGASSERAGMPADDGDDGAGTRTGDRGEDGTGDRRATTTSSSVATSMTATPTTASPTTTTTAPTTTTVPTTAAPTTTAPPSASTTTTPPTTASALSVPPEVEEVLARVNEARAAVGCAALTLDDRLTAAAQLHSDDMAARGYMAHVSPEGMDPTARAAAQGYPGGVGENIAQGYPDAAAVMGGWMGSDGHRANIENCGYRDIGIGLTTDGWYWTQVFG